MEREISSGQKSITASSGVEIGGVSLLEIRSFINSDPSRLVDIWSRQPPIRGRVPEITTVLLEEMIFSKPYFDPSGLLLAFDEGTAVGFLLAGFAPNSELMDLDNSLGIISTIQVIPSENAERIGRQLLDRGLDYLRTNGASWVYVGSRFPHAPYLLGMYGGSRVPGVLSDDHFSYNLLASSGFTMTDEVLIFQRPLAEFKKIVDPQQRTCSRLYDLEKIEDPTPIHWWDACTLGKSSRVRFLLLERETGREIARVTYWDIHPLSRGWGLNAAGLFDLSVVPECRQSGVGTYLVCQSLLEMAQDEISVVEAQILAHDAPANSLFSKLGFEQVGSGQLFMKSLSSR